MSGYQHMLKLFHGSGEVDNPFASRMAGTAESNLFGCIRLPVCQFEHADVSTNPDTLYKHCLEATKKLALSCRQFIKRDTIGGRLSTGSTSVHLPSEDRWQLKDNSGGNAERGPWAAPPRTTFISPLASRRGTAKIVEAVKDPKDKNEHSENLQALLAHFLYMQFHLAFGDAPGVVLDFCQIVQDDVIVGTGEKVAQGDFFKPKKTKGAQQATGGGSGSGEGSAGLSPSPGSSGQEQRNGGELEAQGEVGSDDDEDQSADSNGTTPNLTFAEVAQKVDIPEIKGFRNSTTGNVHLSPFTVNAGEDVDEDDELTDDQMTQFKRRIVLIALQKGTTSTQGASFTAKEEDFRANYENDAIVDDAKEVVEYKASNDLSDDAKLSSESV